MTSDPPAELTWPMIERRKSIEGDKRAAIQEKLDIALAEIQRLYGAAAATAEAVTKAIPRQESEDRAKQRAEEQKRLLIIVSVAHAIMMVLVLWLFASLISSWVKSAVDNDHKVIECLVTTAETTKIADPRGTITDCLTASKE